MPKLSMQHSMKTFQYFYLLFEIITAYIRQIQDHKSSISKPRMSSKLLHSQPLEIRQSIESTKSIKMQQHESKNKSNSVCQKMHSQDSVRLINLIQKRGSQKSEASTQIESPTKQNNSGITFCAQHNNPFKYRCLTCEAFSCEQCCLTTGKHHGHCFERLTASISIPFMADEFTKCFQKIHNKRSEIKNKLKNLKQKQKQSTVNQNQKVQKLDNKIIQLAEHYQIQQFAKFEEYELSITQKYGRLFKYNCQYHILLNKLKQVTKAQLLRTQQNFVTEIQKNKDQLLKVEIAKKDFEKQQSGFLYPKGNEFVYQVKNFSKMKDEKQEIITQEFSACRNKWQLKIYPAGYITPSSATKMKEVEYLSIYVQMLKSVQKQQKFSIKVAVVDKNNKKRCIEKQFKSIFMEGQSWGYDRFIRIPNLYHQNFMSYDNSLIIRVQIAFQNYYEGTIALSSLIDNKQKQFLEKKQKISSLKSQLEKINQQRSKKKQMPQDQQKKTIKHAEISLQQPLSSKVIRLYSMNNAKLIKNSKVLRTYQRESQPAF